MQRKTFERMVFSLSLPFCKIYNSFNHNQPIKQNNIIILWTFFLGDVCMISKKGHLLFNGLQ